MRLSGLVFVCVIIIKSILFKPVHTYNILGVFPFMGKSHFYVFEAYAKELSRRGHNVTVLSYFPQKQPLKNYHDIDLGKDNKYFEFRHPIKVSFFHILVSFTILQPVVGPYTCRMILEDDEVQNLLRSGQKFDLVVMEQFNVDCPLVIAYKLGAPVIAMTSGVLLPWHYSRYGVPYNPSYVSYDIFKGGTKPTFLERIARTLTYHYMNFMQSVCSTSEDRVISDFFKDVPPIEELRRQVKLLLLYQNFVVSGSQLLPSNVIEVGGFHVGIPKKLPKDLKAFIEESANGVIYVSFGTILNGSSMQRYVYDAILGALKKLPYRIVWKWEKEIEGNPDNVYRGKWMPQNDILAHPKVVAFFSHCGQLGTTEAVHHGVPILGMPILADQFANAAIIEEQRLGVHVDINKVTKEMLLEKFNTILEPSFRAHVKELSKMWRDRPVTALNTAVHWTEFVARYPNATFRSPIAEIPMYQYLCLDGKSHYIVHRIYLQELVRRGHNVTIISHFPETNPPQNHHDVSLAGSIKILEDDMPLVRNYRTVISIATFLTESGRENCEVMLANKNVQDLMRRKPKFDVAVVEQFNSDCGLGLAHVLGAPVVGLTSHILMPWTYNRFGIPYHPAYVSFHFLEGGTKPTLYQRIERVLFDYYFKTRYYMAQKRDQQSLAKYFDDIPPLEDLAKEIKLLLLYQNFVLTGSQLFPANVIEIGGYHVSEAKPLTGELLEFVEEAEHGVIYISFGSVIKSSTMPEDKLQALLGAISELPQRFIWKWESKTMLLDKNKLYLADWLPQVDILGHPKTLAFLSHGGMGGTTEAIHFGVPVVAVPVFGDQPSNAAAIEESGLGVQLQIYELTKDKIVGAFKKVLDPGFRANVKEVSKAWSDRPMKPLDTAVYWTEYVARHPNITYKPAAVNTPLYQYIYLDIVIVFASTLLVLFLFTKTCLTLACKKSKVVKQKNKKDKAKSKRS
ncbi:unnamed protein product [Leptosia nina]|uniref:UDP-glycosyltransferases domain-containing protein n=1 Tax=Leptosia nina TaxID=320188 RepID=A0AAV1J0X9_9NEOP